MKPTDIQRFCQLGQECVSYRPEKKERFLREGRRYLREVAKQLGLAAGSYDLRVNKGGIAVSGEITLHTDTLYVQISQSGMGPGYAMLYRTCQGRRDHSGGDNRWMGWHHLANIACVVATLGQFVPEREAIAA